MSFKILVLSLLPVISFGNEIDEALNKARAIKVKNGEAKGIVLTDVKSGGIFEKLGLRSGDKIVKVNDQKVKDLNDIMSAMSKVESITVNRNGKEETLNYK